MYANFFFSENKYDGTIFGMWQYESDQYVKFAQLWLINGLLIIVFMLFGHQPQGSVLECQILGVGGHGFKSKHQI